MGNPFSSCSVLIRFNATRLLVTLSRPTNTLPYVPWPTCSFFSKTLTSRRTTGARIDREVVRTRLAAGGTRMAARFTGGALGGGARGEVALGGGGGGGGKERFGGGGGAFRGGGGGGLGLFPGGGGGGRLGRPAGGGTIVEALAIFIRRGNSRKINMDIDRKRRDANLAVVCRRTQTERFAKCDGRFSPGGRKFEKVELSGFSLWDLL